MSCCCSSGPDREADAAASLRRAVEVARERGTRAFELRAATSLARLLARTGDPGAGEGLLAGIYTTFTEGFDTRDLREASAALGDLRRTSQTRA